MKLRNKILIALSCIVMTVMIAGLSMGIVYVYNADPVAKSMQVSYSVGRVGCRITAEGWLHNEDVTEIGVVGDKNITFDDKRAVSQAIDFADVTLGNNGLGYAVYIFAVHNITISRLCDIKIEAELLDSSTGYNIMVRMGETEASAVETDSCYIGGIGNGETKRLVIVLSVADPCLDAELNANFSIKISEDRPTSVA